VAVNQYAFDDKTHWRPLSHPAAIVSQQAGCRPAGGLTPDRPRLPLIRWGGNGEIGFPSLLVPKFGGGWRAPRLTSTGVSRSKTSRSTIADSESMRVIVPIFPANGLGQVHSGGLGAGERVHEPSPLAQTRNGPGERRGRDAAIRLTEGNAQPGRYHGRSVNFTRMGDSLEVRPASRTSGVQ